MEILLGGIVVLALLTYAAVTFKFNLHANPFVGREWEEIHEPEVEEIIDPEDAVLLSKDELQKMTKADIEAYAREFGVELDRRKTKANMIDLFIEQR